jgi:hypothetical protein
LAAGAKLGRGTNSSPGVGNFHQPSHFVDQEEMPPTPPSWRSGHHRANRNIYGIDKEPARLDFTLKGEPLPDKLAKGSPEGEAA